jgi:hypothetical protein
MNLGNFGFSEAIAFVALLVAFYYGWQNSKLTKQLLVKEAGEAEAKSRADLGANFVKIGRNNYRLKIFNRGSVAARNVRIELKHEDEEDHCLSQGEIESKFPHECIEPHQGVELFAAIHIGSKSKHPLRLIWDDDLRQNNEKMVYPTI